MPRGPRSPLFTPSDLVWFWLREYGGAALVAVGLCMIFGGLYAWAQRSTTGPETYEEARVLRFGYKDGEFPQPLVIVRTRDGVVRQLAARRQALRHCRKGDPITLVRRGTALLVHRQGCRREGPERAATGVAPDAPKTARRGG